MIEIEKNIPMPDFAQGRTKYPWRTMEIGDSFLFPKTSAHEQCSVANRKYAPKRFQARTTDKGLRVWRVA